MNKENKSLIWFTLLSYIDKGISFLLPLTILYIFKDQESYNSLEYAYSIANIAVYLFTIGSMYSFYGFKESIDKQRYTSDYLFISCVSVIFVALFTLGIAFIKPTIGKEISFVVYLLLAARITLVLFVNLYSSYCRLIDKPSLVLLYSIAINILIILSLLFFYYFDLNLLYSFALPELLIPVFICICICVLRRIKTVSFSQVVDYYKSSFRFAWPIVLNCLLSLGVTNFGKIYAFNYMTPDDMYVFSYTMRISLVIGMAHTSIMAFYSKDIYTNKFTSSIALKYAIFIISSALISFIIILFLNRFLPQQLPIDLSMLIILGYNILFCAGSFCEAFYGRQNKNKIVLKYSIISSLVFVLLILIIPKKTILNICFSMLLYSVLRLYLMLHGLDVLKKIRNC